MAVLSPMAIASNQPRTAFKIFYSAVRSRSTSRYAAHNSRSPRHSSSTPHDRQRYGGAQRQELGAAPVAFITIG
jgi:hypothetical protein